MELTLLLSKILGPLLLIRALSILLSRQHFHQMIDGLDREATTVSFSFFPIALFIASITILLVHDDSSSVAAILIRVIAWGGLAKSAVLMLFPSFVLAKAMLLGKAGFLSVALFVCLVAGGYFTWFGYFAI